MGVLPGWWLGKDDGRTSQPYVDKERWEKELLTAGFSGIDSVVFDGYNNNILAHLPVEEPAKRVTILCNDPSPESIIASLVDAGYEIDFCTTLDTPLPGQHILSLLDLEAPFLHDATEPQFDALIQFLDHAQQCGLLWVTRAAQIECRDPRYSMILGIARTARTELGMDFATLELEVVDDGAAAAVLSVLREFQIRLREPEVDPTMEWAYSAGEVRISSYHWINIGHELLDLRNPSKLVKLEIEKPGLANTLQWKQVEPLEVVDDLVEVEVRSVGMNFKVILICFNQSKVTELF
jgi:hypothetical protein